MPNIEVAIVLAPEDRARRAALRPALIEIHRARVAARALSETLNFRLGSPPFFLKQRCGSVLEGSTRDGILRYLFEDCALDTGRRELRRGEALVAIEPQVFDLLVHLIGHRDRV